MKFIRNLILFFIVLVAVVFIGRNTILKAAIEQGVTAVTGFKTTVASVKYDLPSTIHIEGLEIRNPAGFKEEIFTSIPEIYVNLVLPELLQGKAIHLQEIRLNLQEVHIEKNEKGVSNIELLSSVGGQQAKQGGAPAKPAPSEKKAAMPFLLDKLELTIRSVSFEDHSGLIGAAAVVPKKVSVDLNVNKEVFANITDPQTLVNLIVVKIVRGATFGNLLNLSPDKLLGDNLNNVMNSGQKIIGEQAQALQKGLGDMGAQATDFMNQSQTAQKAGALIDDSMQNAQGALGDTATAAKEKLSGLFGKVKSIANEQTAETKAAN